MNRKRLVWVGLVGLLTLLLAGHVTNPSLANFDSNGYADLAIGTPYEDVIGDQDAGSVSVIYGASAGLSSAGNQYWQQNYLDSGTSEPHDAFGMTLAVGDFDGDGYFDLAVGAPFEDVGSVNNAGAVNVIYGAASGGLDAVGNQYWNQDEAGMGGAAEENDRFGSALGVGDFNGDGYDDLAVGIPEEDIGSTVDAGGMMVLYGSAGGLTAANTVWNEGSGAETGDEYGKTLAAGDFNQDGYEDLAVGIPREDLDLVNVGAVKIYYGSSGGLIERASDDFWHQDRSGVADTAEEEDFFGWSLTEGDFNGDGYMDLAVGVPNEDVGSPAVVDAGAVNVFYGSAIGIAGLNSDYWHQDVLNIQDLCEENDGFGFTLAAGDFDGDGYFDLAVGLPFEHWNDPDTGIVQVLYGTADGLTDVSNQLWRQDSTGILDTEEAYENFGYALAAGDFNGDGYAELAIGVPNESIESVARAGAVHVLYGSASRLTSTGNQFWYQGSGGLQGTAETADQFGYALAAAPVVKHNIYLPLMLKN